MRIMSLFAIATLSLTATAPAFAQDAMKKDPMKSDKMMRISDADMKKMKSCQAMSHDAMTKDADCVKMMKSHPAAAQSGSMMSPGN